MVKEGALTKKIALLKSSAQRDLHKALDRLRRLNVFILIAWFLGFLMGILSLDSLHGDLAVIKELR